MRRAFGLIVLVAALGTAPACLAQDLAGQQQQQQQRDNTLQNDGIRRELPPPKFVPAKAYAKGVEALKAKRYKEAVKTLARVTDEAPDNPAAWRLLGVAYSGEQRWDAARRAYKRALYLAPDDVISHAGLGAALVALNDPKAQAQADWLKAKAEACKDACPEAPLLKALERSGPFAVPPSTS
jgi:tetratricopeptide (TPR) repeat protein